MPRFKKTSGKDRAFGILDFEFISDFGFGFSDFGPE
jgi:hypothetical protein